MRDEIPDAPFFATENDEDDFGWVIPPSSEDSKRIPVALKRTATGLYFEPWEAYSDDLDEIILKCEVCGGSGEGEPVPIEYVLQYIPPDPWEDEYYDESWDDDYDEYEVTRDGFLTEDTEYTIVRPCPACGGRPELVITKRELRERASKDPNYMLFDLDYARTLFGRCPECG